MNMAVAMLILFSLAGSFAVISLALEYKFGTVSKVVRIMERGKL
jgi:hypothetical protein